MVMEMVTHESLPKYIARYADARGGELNEETTSEAAFVVIAKYRGAYILNTGIGPIWVGVQNASARWTDSGKPFASVTAAVEDALSGGHPTSMGAIVFYSENAAERLRWLADKIDELKESGTFLLWS